MPTKFARPAASRRAARATFSDELRDQIDRSGLTAYALGQSAGVDPGVISRFMREERGLTTATIDRLARALGLHLAAPIRAKGRPRKGTAIVTEQDPAALDG